MLPYECKISKNETQRIACGALLEVFEPRQTRLRLLVEWLRRRRESVEVESKRRCT